MKSYLILEISSQHLIQKLSHFKVKSTHSTQQPQNLSYTLKQLVNNLTFKELHISMVNYNNTLL